MATSLRKAGEFCWVNILTPRPDEAREFFARLLGWSYFEIPGQGHGMSVDGRPIGGLFDLHGPNTPPGLEPMVGVMIKVDDADAFREKVLALGGRSRPAFDIGDQGRMTVCHDPNGAEFDAWEPKKMLGTEVDCLLHGAPSWFETLTTDVELGTKFYSDLLGWVPEVVPKPGFEYTVFRQDGAKVAGLMPILPGMVGLKPHWAAYFTVKDVDEAAEVAAGLGGRVHVPPQDIPDVGRFCGLASPQGVVFYVMSYLA